jgi:uncharacterized membrane protein YphA (DoxX/SURF4 family)
MGRAPIQAASAWQPSIYAASKELTWQVFRFSNSTGDPCSAYAKERLTGIAHVRPWRTSRRLASWGRGGDCCYEGDSIMNVVLWIVQALLAALFLFAGGMKLIIPIDEMMKQMPLALPAWFLRFTGVVEILGALGLVLPWLLRIQPALTPLAAAGLVIVMTGAVVYSVVAGSVASALIPLVVGLFCAFVAYGRWRLTPHP